MTIFTFGINYRTAALDLREKVAFAPENMIRALRNAIEVTGIGEVAILSTCNRTEIYFVDPNDSHGSAEKILDWLADYHQLSASESLVA